MCLLAFAGEQHPPQFAAQLNAAEREIMRELSIEGANRLQIAVPITQRDKVVGVIEVLQRTEAEPATPRGYLKFLQQVAAIVAECSFS